MESQLRHQKLNVAKGLRRRWPYLDLGPLADPHRPQIVYLAQGVELGETHREPTELMEIRLVPVQEALRMAHEGEISDGPSALALLWCRPLLCLATNASDCV